MGGCCLCTYIIDCEVVKVHQQYCPPPPPTVPLSSGPSSSAQCAATSQLCLLLPQDNLCAVLSLSNNLTHVTFLRSRAHTNAQVFPARGLQSEYYEYMYILLTHNRVPFPALEIMLTWSYFHLFQQQCGTFIHFWSAAFSTFIYLELSQL